jgi:hypothetical protein
VLVQSAIQPFKRISTLKNALVLIGCDIEPQSIFQCISNCFKHRSLRRTQTTIDSMATLPLKNTTEPLPSSTCQQDLGTWYCSLPPSAPSASIALEFLEKARTLQYWSAHLVRCPGKRTQRVAGATSDVSARAIINFHSIFESNRDALILSQYFGRTRS